MIVCNFDTSNTSENTVRVCGYLSLSILSAAATACRMKVHAHFGTGSAALNGKHMDDALYSVFSVHVL